MPSKRLSRYSKQHSIIWIIVSLAFPVIVFLLYLAIVTIFNMTSTLNSLIFYFYTLIGMIIAGVILELVAIVQLAGLKKLITVVPLLLLILAGLGITYLTLFIIHF